MKRQHPHGIGDWETTLWPHGIRTTIVRDRWFVLGFDAEKLPFPEPGFDPTLDILPGYEP